MVKIIVVGVIVFLFFGVIDYASIVAGNRSKEEDDMEDTEWD